MHPPGVEECNLLQSPGLNGTLFSLIIHTPHTIYKYGFLLNIRIADTPMNYVWGVLSHNGLIVFVI